MDIAEKLASLRKIIQSMGRVVVAYSGGVDSTFLALVAHQELGEGAAALTAVSPSLPVADLDEAVQIAERFGFRHVLLDSREVENPDYLANTPRRCYFCRKETSRLLIEFAGDGDYACVIDGNNLDDTADYRPGRQAAVENGVRSPLIEAGFTKADVRACARLLGLPNWDKPSAACLSSRIPSGTPITAQLLIRVERGEAYLRALGLRQTRLRHHGEIARLEVCTQDFQTVLERREEIVEHLCALGYTFVALDLAGFRSGSLNALNKGEA